MARQKQTWPSWVEVGDQVGTSFSQVVTKNGQVGSEVSTFLQLLTSLDRFFNLSVSLAGYTVLTLNFSVLINVINVIATRFSKHAVDGLVFCMFLCVEQLEIFRCQLVQLEFPLCQLM